MVGLQRTGLDTPDYPLRAEHKFSLLAHILAVQALPGLLVWVNCEGGIALVKDCGAHRHYNPIYPCMTERRTYLGYMIHRYSWGTRYRHVAIIRIGQPYVNWYTRCMRVWLASNLFVVTGTRCPTFDRHMCAEKRVARPTVRVKRLDVPLQARRLHPGSQRPFPRR